MKYRKLPHIDMPEHYQFVTFRTHDSLDTYLQKLYDLPLENAKKQFIIDEHLDRSSNGAYLNGECIDIFFEVVREKEEKLYETVACAVMPNHVHLLFRQIAPLPEAVKYIKAASAVQLNRMLGRSGRFWAREYYDKAIRDDAHFETVYRYVVNNPVKVGLKDAEVRVYGVYGNG